MPDVDGDGDGVGFLVAEWDRESILGVEAGDNVGGVGDSGSLVESTGVFLACFLGRNNLGWSLLLFFRCRLFQLFFLPLSLCGRISAIPPSLQVY